MHINLFVAPMSRYMDGQLSEKNDIYSFGVILLELISGREVIHDGVSIVTLVSFVRLVDRCFDIPALCFWH